MLPVHNATGKPAPNAITQHKIEPLMRHLQYLTNLGEVRATRVVSHMVEGMEERTNHGLDDDAIYLPRYMTIRSCYKWHMNMLRYNAWTTGSGVSIIERDDGKDIDTDDFVSFPTYFHMWKSKFPKLKASKPAEDICQYCYAFANRHKYLANRSLRQGGDGDDGDDTNDGDLPTDDGNEEEGAEEEATNDGEEATNDGERCATPIRGVNLNTPEASCTEVEEERELMLLEAAEHIKMARAQRALYQAKVELAVRDATEKKKHCDRVYTFVVDYGQNMELPSYQKEQPGCTYYYSPLSVYNLGVVNHAHVYDDGRVSARLHAHVYHEGVA